MTKTFVELNKLFVFSTLKICTVNKIYSCKHIGAVFSKFVFTHIEPEIFASVALAYTKLTPVVFLSIVFTEEFVHTPKICEKIISLRNC